MSTSSSITTNGYQSVIKSKEFEHKICGMNQQVINYLRQYKINVTNAETFFTPIINKLNQRIHSIYNNNINNINNNGINNNVANNLNVINIGYSFGNVGSVFYVNNLDLNNNDIIICFILDSLDIDSKMITAVNIHSNKVSANENSKVWSLLYKFNCSP
ncbi:hypothetical protein ABK040_012789 [Willaertia magna]